MRGHAHAVGCDPPQARLESRRPATAKRRPRRGASAAFLWPERDPFGMMRPDSRGFAQHAGQASRDVPATTDIRQKEDSVA